MTQHDKPALSAAAIRSIVIGLMLIILLGALDQTIVSVSLPQMAHDLGGVSLLAWVVSGYLVASTVATPVYGKLGDLYGRRLMLSVAVTIFLLASIACAVAWSMPVLVLARVLQGIGGGGLISTAQAIVGEVVPLRERGRYQGYISVVYAVASVGGPVLGGYLTHFLSWHWVFWINLPLGIAALWVSRRALTVLPVPGIRLPIDYAGAFLLTAGLSVLLIAFTLLGHGAGLVEARTLGLLAAAVALLAVFVWHENRTAEPIMPLGLFKVKTVWIGCSILFISFFQVVSLSVLMPYGMQTLDGIGPDAAALRLIAFSLAVPAGAFTSGRLMMHSGRYKPLQLIGTAILPLATFVLAWLGPHADAANGAALAFCGLSIGMTMPTSLVAVQNAVPPKNIGVATAMTALFRSMGGAIGVAILSSILFALMPHALAGATSALGAEHGLAASGTVTATAGAHDAAFAFRVTLLCSGLISALAHLLAWNIPEASISSGRG
ncbi:MFS transporter [Oxalobacteraceae bacterium OM1]|nr:MFS transporter [Oxalobacteraceae bacterium OM1]